MTMADSRLHDSAGAFRLQRRITELEAENARLRAALEQVEWVGSQGAKFCPWCFHWKMDDHAPDCARQSALRRSEGGK